MKLFYASKNRKKTFNEISACVFKTAYIRSSDVSFLFVEVFGIRFIQRLLMPVVLGESSVVTVSVVGVKLAPITCFAIQRM
ncbi:MAG: hypothetical protein PHO09_06970 [Sphaerochaeta sp.]|nr:hypothetical protein [Sphaerochaeta sp.]